MTNKTTREYRTSHGTIDSFESTGTRTDSYQLVAEDWIPTFPGFPSFGEHMARRLAKAAKKRRDATLLQKMAALGDKIEVMLAKAQNDRLLRKRRADDAEARRARTSKAFRERVLAAHEQTRGN
jgi:hypothetical protein